MRLLRDILKRAIAATPIKDVVAEVGDKHVGMAVVVVVTDADALSPAFRGESGFQCDIGKAALSLVVIELQMRMYAGLSGVESRAVSDENVVAAVAIVIEDSDAVSGRFQNIVFVFQAAVNVAPGQPGLRGDIVPQLF